MFLFKKENGIILNLIVFMAASFFYLAYTEQKQRDLNSYNVWELYFEDPKSDNLNFVIENHSLKTNFHWELISGNDKISEGDVKIAKGSTWTSDVQVDNLSEKTIIIVSDGKNKKEIYKDF